MNKKRSNSSKIMSKVLAIILTFCLIFGTVPAAFAAQGTVSVGSASGVAGSSVTIPVSISSPAGIAGYQFDITYDASKVLATGVTNGITSVTKNLNNASNGELRFSWAGSEALSEAGTLFSVSFDIKADAAAGDIALVIEDTLFNDENVATIDITPQNGVITVQEDPNALENAKIAFKAVTATVAQKLQAANDAIVAATSTAATVTAAKAEVTAAIAAVNAANKTDAEIDAMTVVADITAAKTALESALSDLDGKVVALNAAQAAADAAMNLAEAQAAFKTVTATVAGKVYEANTAIAAATNPAAEVIAAKAEVTAAITAVNAANKTDAEIDAMTDSMGVVAAMNTLSAALSDLDAKVSALNAAQAAADEADQAAVDAFAASIVNREIVIYSDEALPYTITKPVAADLGVYWANTTLAGGMLAIEGAGSGADTAKVIARPAYSDAQVTGTLTLRVEKNSAQALIEYTVIIKPDLNPFQKVMIEALSLSDAERSQFVAEVLTPLRTVDSTVYGAVYGAVYVTPELVSKACDILDSVSTTDARKALEAYVPYSAAKKLVIENAINEGLPTSLNNATGFTNIAAAINGEVTGNPTNDTGLKFIVKLLSTVTSMTGPIAFNDSSDASKIDFKMEGYESVKSTVSSLVDCVETLANKINGYTGDTHFDKLLSYAEQLVNAQPSEVAAFKLFLKNNGSIFEGTINTGKDDDNDSPTGGGGGGGGASTTKTMQQTGDADQSIKDGAAALDKVIGSQSANKDVKTAAKKAIEDAVRAAAKITVDSKDVTVEGTKAMLEVQEEALRTAIKNAAKVAEALEKQAKAEGIDAAAKRIVTIEVPDVAGAKEVAAKIPADILDFAKNNDIDRIAIDTGIATIAIAPDALQGSVNSGSKDVEVSVAAVDKDALSEEVAAKVGNHPVYDFNLSVDGKKVSQFAGENPVEISVDYKLAAGEDPDKIVIYYINDNGELEVVKNCKYDTATGKVTFTTDHFSKYTVMEADITFNDLSTVSWAKTYIEALAGREILSGVGDGKFDPNSNVTREQFAKMIVEAFGLMDETAKTSLSDVDQKAWYAKYVASAQKAGVINGIGGNKFGVGSKISRQDMAVMAYRAAVAANVELEMVNEKETFVDNASIASYAAEAVSIMQQANIINGVGGNMFAPTDNATRAAAAKIIYLLYKGL